MRYEFKEIEIEIDEASIFVSGNIEVEYEVEAPQWSVGFPGGIELTGIGDIEYDILHQEDGESWLGKNYYKGRIASSGEKVFDHIFTAIERDLYEAAARDAGI